MNSLTKEIKSKLGLELLPEPTNDKWKCFDTGGVEVSVGEFLYGLARILRPENILETGTYSAISCIYFALALKENGFGKIDTIEIEKQHIDRSTERLKKLGLLNLVTLHNISSLKFKPTKQYDLMFLDTELNLRFLELVKFYDNLKEGGYCLIHDMPRSLAQENINPDHPKFKHWPVGEIPDQVKQWVKSGELKPFYFPNPRGMIGLYKKHKEDYL